MSSFENKGRHPQYQNTAAECPPTSNMYPTTRPTVRLSELLECVHRDLHETLPNTHSSGPSHAAMEMAHRVLGRDWYLQQCTERGRKASDEAARRCMLVQRPPPAIPAVATAPTDAAVGGANRGSWETPSAPTQRELEKLPPAADGFGLPPGAALFAQKYLTVVFPCRCPWAEDVCEQLGVKTTHADVEDRRTFILYGRKKETEQLQAVFSRYRAEVDAAPTNEADKKNNNRGCIVHDGNSDGKFSSSTSGGGGGSSIDGDDSSDEEQYDNDSEDNRNKDGNESENAASICSSKNAHVADDCDAKTTTTTNTDEDIDVPSDADASDDGYESPSLPLTSEELCGFDHEEAFMDALLDTEKAGRNVLVHGPPGNSKSQTIGHVLYHGELPFAYITTAQVVDAHVGRTERNIDALFRVLDLMAPCVLVLEEIDAMVPDRNRVGPQGEHVVRMINQLLQNIERSRAAVVATTNRIEALDAASLRRFGHTIAMTRPDDSVLLGLAKRVVRHWHLSIRSQVYKTFDRERLIKQVESTADLLRRLRNFRDGWTQCGLDLKRTVYNGNEHAHLLRELWC